MAIFKCKMCGGDLEIQEGLTICECEYCGTKQTIPALDNEKKLNLFNRANRLRLNSEFDKAASIYENIIAEFPEEAEGYWGLVLCNYGIEYVDDPATAKKIPTCHRAAFESVTKDENYELALEYADVISQKVYRDEAREIDRIMSEILSISKNEEPYDIFICYKETDTSGARTIDSVIAQDVYEALTDKGYRVFFSRISLEDKIGKQYEPYIFAALNSAKVMLAFGTKYEYFHAVWVKNEWSRFLKLMAKDKSKSLVPCYKDLDPYDMPDEFKALQAQDMGKVGAIQDLVRGIEKLIGSEKAKETIVVNNNFRADIESLLKCAYMFLADGEWENANEYFEKVLDIDPANGQAYLGKFMVDLKLRKETDFSDIKVDFGTNINYRKVLVFCDENTKNNLKGILENIIKNGIAEKQRKEVEAKAEAEKRTKHIEEITRHLFIISSGKNHTVGLKSDGTVVAVGSNSYDKCIIDNWSDKVSVSAGADHTVGLNSNGTVVAVGSNDFSQRLVGNWIDIVAVSAGFYHTVGLKSDGAVVAVGNNDFGQCDVENWMEIQIISSGKNHTVGLKADGIVVAVGNNDFGQCDVENWTDIIDVSSGENHTVGLKSDGNVVAVGNNDFGQCDVSDWKDIISLYAGSNHTAGLKSNGTVVAVGHNEGGQCNVSDWTDIVAISAGSGNTVGVKSDGTVVAAGSNSYGCSDVSKWKLFNNIETIKEERNWRYQQAQYRSRGLCQYCGGEFKGLLSKKCEKCGKPKDY